MATPHNETQYIVDHIERPYDDEDLPYALDIDYSDIDYDTSPEPEGDSDEIYKLGD